MKKVQAVKLSNRNGNQRRGLGYGMNNTYITLKAAGMDVIIK